MNRAERRRQRKKARKTANPSSGQPAPSSQQTLDIAKHHHAESRLPEAEHLYQKILDTDPNHPVALHLSGLIAHQLGNNDTAVDLITRAISIRPDYYEAYCNLGLALKDLGHLDEAVASYQKALAIKPDLAEGHGNLGLVFKDLGLLDEAVASYRKALAIKSDLAEVHGNLGVAIQGQGKLDEAVASYRRALAIKPDDAEMHSNLGNAFLELGRLDESVASHQKALAIKPDYAAARSNLGLALIELGQPGEAIACYRKALAIKPGYAEAHNNLGNALKELGRLEEAVASYRQALAIKPGYAEAHSNLVFAEQYRTGVTLKKLNAFHAEWDKRHGVPLQTEWRNHDNIPDPERPPRIGFISSSLGRHPVGYFVVKLLQLRPVGQFEVICYSDRIPDDMTQRIMAYSDEWMNTRGVSDLALSRRIRSDRIDILIDLSGHTEKNRLLVIARKPAPIQVKWVGYAGSVGLSAMDYLIADCHHVPEGMAEHYSEKVIRLPDGYVSYEPPAYAPRVGSPPMERNGFITFGSFNNPAKINAGGLAAWADILKAVPNSRLVLKYGFMNAEGNRIRILDQFAAHGVEGARLTLEGKSPHAELLARYNDIDIALDTFPYTGGLTTCEALWMGVPVITKPGETFASRHSLSHLANVGVAELVAEDARDYVSKAVDLAKDTSRLAGLRSGLRERMAKSALCDGEKFATDFTSAMRLIWREWCSRTQTDSYPIT